MGELYAHLEHIEKITLKANLENKGFIVGKYYQMICKIVNRCKLHLLCLVNIPKFYESVRNTLLPLYSKIVLTMGHEQSSCGVDDMYEATYGSMVNSIIERNEITQSYLNMCVKLGEYNHLKAISKKFKQKLDLDTDVSKKVPISSKVVSTKVFDRKLHKRICTSILKALHTQVNDAYQSHI